jgi:hypothetical protein
MLRKTIATSAVLLSLAAAMAEFEITPVVIEGDPVVLVNGTGFVRTLSALSVNDNGEWLVEVDTDWSNTDEDVAVVRGFQASPYITWAQESEALTSPPGATINWFDSLWLNNFSQVSMNMGLDGTSGSSDDSGVFFNKDLVIQEGSISTAPEFPGPTPYVGFFDTKMTDFDEILITASVDIPNVGTSVDRALVLATNPAGVPVEKVIVQEGDELVTGRYVEDLGTGPHATAILSDGRGEKVMYVADLDGDSTTDDLLCLYDGTATQVIAQEGGPSPVAGRVWATLSSAEVDLAGGSDFIYTGTLEGDPSTASVIIKNDVVFKQEGDAVTTPGGTWSLTSFGTGPVFIGDSGDVVWYGDWDDPDTTRDTGLFINDDLVVQKGVTRIKVGGSDLLLEHIFGVSEALAMSGSGEWVLFRGRLEGGIDGAFLIHVIAPPEWCLGDADCSGGAPDFGDIEYFVAALTGEQAWLDYHKTHGQLFDPPPCPYLVSDFNGGGVEFTDVQPFVASLGQPCVPY